MRELTSRGALTWLVLAVIVALFPYQPAARAMTRPLDGQALPVAWIWPGSAPCNTTLQACVTNASSGDTVLVAQSGTISEQITIRDKSLILTAQTGFNPVIDAGVVVNSSGGATVDVTISDIDFAHSVLVSLSQGTGNVVTLDHISAVSSGADPGVYATVYNESTVNVLHSTFADGGFYPGIELTSPVSHANLTYNVIGNSVTGHGRSDNPTGIYLNATDAGTLKVNVYNNAVWDVGQGTPGSTSGGIFLGARDSLDADFNVVGNTFSKIAADGIRVNDEQDAPNHLSLDLFNNIVAGTTGSAVNVTSDGEPATFVVRGGRNDFTSNGQKNHTLGNPLGTNLSVTPKFVHPSTGNLALQSTSPVIDEGVTCSLGGVAGPDAAGKNRRFRSSVDIGAYEFGAGQPGLVLLGTSAPDTLTGGAGNDILCGYGGDDTLHGRGNNDLVDGGKGHDRLFGGPGDDMLCAKDGSGGDHLSGGKGTDAYDADPGDVTATVEKPSSC